MSRTNVNIANQTALLSSGRKTLLSKRIVSFFVFFLMLPFYCPAFFIQVSETLKLIINAFRIVSFIIIVVLYLISNRRPTPPLIVVLLMQLWFLIVTFIFNRIFFNASIFNTIAIFSIFLLMELFEKQKYEVTKGLLFLFELLIYSNLFFTLFDVLPHYEGYRGFLGADNSLILFFVPGFLISAIHCYQKKGFIRFFIFATAIITTLLIVWSATAIVSFACCLFLLILFRNKKHIPKIRLLWAITAVFTIVLVFFTPAITNSSIYRWLVADVLKKDITLSERIGVWSAALIMIKTSPLFGYGYNATVVIAADDFASHAHNMYLELFVVGGVLYFLLFLTLMILVVKKVDQYKNKTFSVIFVAVLLSIFISFITEAYSELWKFFIVFAISLKINQFDTKSHTDSILSTGFKRIVK